MIEAALQFARSGLPVFPLHTALANDSGGRHCSCGRYDCGQAAKHPLPRLAPKGFKNATTNERIVRHWWNTFPAANIGLATGAIIAIDVDPRHGGDETLASLEREHQSLPQTWRTLTGGGGEHILFAPHPEISIPSSAGKMPGIDVRGAGGYIVAPPSIHISGQAYAWNVDFHPDDTPLATLPTWLAEQFSSARKCAAAKGGDYWAALIASQIFEGERDKVLTALAGHLLRRYIDPRVALELLRSFNATNCVPPKHERDIVRIVNSIAGIELKRREANHARRR